MGKGRNFRMIPFHVQRNKEIQTVTQVISVPQNLQVFCFKSVIELRNKKRSLEQVLN